MPIRRTLLAASLAVATTLTMTPLASVAQGAWPNKPVRIIVPFPAGGSTDVIARQLAQHLGNTLGQQFVVENKAGAGGNIGTDAMAKAAPDGYTIGLSTSGPLANNKSLYKDMPYDSDKDLSPIALVGEIPLVIVSNPQVKAANLKEFLALAKTDPKAISVGHPGNGTIGHLALEALKSSAGVEMQSVPYKGDTPAMTDLLGGSIQAISAPVTAFIPNIQSNKLVALAVTSKKRFPGLPNVATAQELGVNLEATVWFAIVGPAGMPRPIVERLNQEINQFTSSPEGSAKLAQFGMVHVKGGPDLLGTLMTAEAAKWKKVVEAAKVTIN
ncbi:MAG: tripartite tricarboxylate transporter substrate binding protein [Rhodoferax sp.]|nr:tripartite tricarboxylate transporter substrate binding protein [Rhodoferax sp.]MCB2007156.1 tripartite tricarboxylate transporter substrate binding protein [Rhodoferax sp.]MCB2028602.1 tripartite tricarboxylate transporter substrate binding protein [Rhodoferax sp.]MCB2041732.1 tripartite tricarboxylate transporter substrate binding protein [Rhodoferax sp.]MCP5262394.1 tripartite tricarboxylate transporter substrate binding protein [Rhodoferax sp.]